jgi:hypothetical protein
MRLVVDRGAVDVHHSASRPKANFTPEGHPSDGRRKRNLVLAISARFRIVGLDDAGDGANNSSGFHSRTTPARLWARRSCPCSRRRWHDLKPPPKIDAQPMGHIRRANHGPMTVCGSRVAHFEGFDLQTNCPGTVDRWALRQCASAIQIALVDNNPAGRVHRVINVRIFQTTSGLLPPISG